MALLKNITISLDFLFPPKLEISACFSADVEDTGGTLEDCINDATLYHTKNSTVYLFPVYRKLAEKNRLKFSIKYNKVISLRRYIYAGLIWLSDYVVKTKGLEYYKKTMQVTYDGF